MSSSAYLLVSHGSRDPRPQRGMDQLAELMAQCLVQPHRQQQKQQQLGPSLATVSHAIAPPRPLRPPSANSYLPPYIGTAVLELAPLPLHQQIQQFSDRALALGYRQTKIVPLFLLPGVHVMQDIPAEVAIAQRILGSAMTLSITPHVGSHPALASLFSQTMFSQFKETSAATGWIVVSHGSRRPGANQPVETIAARLNALPAYWAIAPSLDEQVNRRVQQGCQQIGITPFFLFEGSITDAIAQQVNQLQRQFPYTRLNFGQPLGASVELVQCIMDLLKEH